MKVTYLQFNPAYLASEENLNHVEGLIQDVDADLIVLPELFNSGYFFRSTADAEAVAEHVPEGPTTQRLQVWASETDATIVAGLPEHSDGTLYNSAVAISPEGYVGTYRKVHLYYEENLHFTPGDATLPVFDLIDRAGRDYRLGIMICFDWYFPEAARTLALRGADVIAHPSNLVRPDCPRAMPIRALENHVFTITANRYGQESNGRETLTFIGQSEICDPAGQVLARANHVGDAVAIVEIDPHDARERKITAHNDLFEDRQPALYATGG